VTDDPRWGTAIVWFRRDLRSADHPALTAAVERARTVVPLFVLERGLFERAPARAWFLAGTLRLLAVDLAERGAQLRVVEGPARIAVAQLAEEVGADVVLASRDVTPFSHRRDRGVADALGASDRELRLLPGTLLVEPERQLTGAGRPYGVFTPFWRALQAKPRRDVLAAPERIPGPAPAAAPSPLPEWLDAIESPASGLPEPGEAAAGVRLQTWVGEDLAHYGSDRNDLDGAGTSHLGADLHLGTLSPRQVEVAALESGVDADPFVRQLAWREFYHHRLFHRRHLSSRASDDPLMAAFRPESADPEAAAAWREGRTGVPTVDAAMRQLAATGWLSNRARLLVASFLTRHLLLDYRVGERHFLRHLIDGDVANNLGGWEWTAGVGSDPQPWFRIFNPVLQGRRFDPDGTWVRRWLPELAPLPDRFIHAPWEMPDDVAAEVGVTIGRDYPRPIIGLAEGRERALAVFKATSERSAAAIEGRER
jgi:deoxyribodipyrimidine photo-lyase